MSLMPTAESTNRSGSTATVRLHDRFDIQYDKPLVEYRTRTAPAFEAVDAKSRASRYFALICDPRQPIRAEAAARLRVLRSQNVLTPIDMGPVDWAPSNRRQLAIIYEQPIGGRLADTADGPMKPWSEESIVANILAPLILGIAEMEKEGLAHRGINPANIFFRDPNRRVAMLGDCVSAAPGLLQPAVYETIEGAMADQSGRGGGGPGADLYALGVLVLHLYQGKMPMAGLPVAEIVEEKLKRGSYQTLVEEGRVSLNLGELVRGLVCDDPQGRWRLQDLHMWLDGRRLTPKPQPQPVRAARGFDLAGESCSTGRHLSWVMDRTGEESAARVMRSQAFEIWLTRTLADRKIMDGVSAAFATRADSTVRGPAQTSQFVARVQMALDPPAPIRYRGLKLAADGIGYALATAMMNGQDLLLLAEVIQSRLAQFWIGRQIHGNLDTRPLERLNRLLEDQRPGYGVERVAYELVPGLHCLSPFVELRYVDTPADMLAALELAVAGGAVESWPIDRHVAAFLAQRERAIDDGMLAALVHQDPAIRVLATLQVLAYLQENYGPQSVPALTNLFGRQCKPVIERFRNRHTRARLQNGLAAVLKENNLKKLALYLDNGDEQKKDALRFHRARIEFQSTIGRLEKCDKDEAELEMTTREAGRTLAVRLASLMGGAIAGISLLVMGLL
jgi:eukaryotic-like serine/threonine-protein kinase